MSETEILEVIAKGETLGIEFKSDRNMLSDRALVEAVVALSNSDGGLLLLGVEDATGEVTRSAVEELVEGGIVEAQGRGSSREYLLSARVYKRRGQELEYVRQAGLTEIEREQMVLKLLKQKPKIKRHDVMELCHIDGKQATALLAKMCKGGDLTRNGERRAAFYVASETFMCHDSAITRS